jgi:hypothetical protein
MRFALGELLLVLVFAALARPAGGVAKIQNVADAKVTDPCAVVPVPVSAALARTPTWSLLHVDNLQADDSALWNARRPQACPGFAPADLGVGSGFAYAIALIRTTRQGNEEEVILLIPTGDQIEQRMLAKPHPVSNPAVVWRAEPGRTRAWDGGPTINVAHDSIIVETIETTAEQFFFVRGRMRRVVTSD